MLAIIITSKKYRLCREWVVQAHMSKHLLNTYKHLGDWGSIEELQMKSLLPGARLSIPLAWAIV